ncbi:hypothetical protein HRR83_002248 [Exophiala dermatitidis]|uniref:Uncharacterized protein n=1 Tax=Exophiala dermatitidis TaxID=5970 RepID=A0AAN6EWU9_EXODE|nr:hypothetical protein HRR74_002325 [Exophiala dermatitidis]KAJ4525599.1 hypothetical protein HRR73_002330 [Exophiala dermatitidis]KAJ4536916.1 hypothetical protein HRR76_004942 [Exophiala dermatitidis]KAJ4555483.1 hypothetical protein HRR77_001413 [Exophiala dermatitidis]KAJ4568788.1 hypothetical protein HRR81_006444 [Exophiala dermatitidis]
MLGNEGKPKVCELVDGKCAVWGRATRAFNLGSNASSTVNTTHLPQAPSIRILNSSVAELFVFPWWMCRNFRSVLEDCGGVRNRLDSKVLGVISEGRRAD